MRLGLATAMAMAMAMALLASGCSDPESDRLEPGGRPTIHNTHQPTVGVFVRVDRAGPVVGLREVMVPVGTRVVVLADEPARPPVQPYLRLVRVRVEEGEHRGDECEVGR